MAYKITLELPEGWEKEITTEKDPEGKKLTHMECHLPDDVAQTDIAEIELWAGAMPSDTTAADEALANYADIVGFDDDDPEDFDPIIEWPFAGKKAYGFEALCEDDSPMRLMCVEIKTGTLVLMSICAKDDATLMDVIQTVERNLRAKAEE